MCNVSLWIQKYNDHILIIGGDFNTHLDKHNPAADFLNNFANEHALHRCINLQTLGEKRFTFLMMPRRHEVKLTCMLCWILMCLISVAFCLIMSQFWSNAQSPCLHVTVSDHPQPQTSLRPVQLRSPSCVGIMPTELDQLLFKMYFNYKIQITF